MTAIYNALSTNPHLHEIDTTWNAGITPNMEKKTKDILQRNAKLREITPEGFNAYDSMALIGFMKTIGFEEQGFFMRALGAYNAIERVKTSAITGSSLFGASVEDMINLGFSPYDAGILRKIISHIFKRKT